MFGKAHPPFGINSDRCIRPFHYDCNGLGDFPWCLHLQGLVDYYNPQDLQESTNLHVIVVQFWSFFTWKDKKSPQTLKGRYTAFCSHMFGREAAIKSNPLWSLREISLNWFKYYFVSPVHIMRINRTEMIYLHMLGREHSTVHLPNIQPQLFHEESVHDGGKQTLAVVHPLVDCSVHLEWWLRFLVHLWFGILLFWRRESVLFRAVVLNWWVLTQKWVADPF